MLLKRTRFIAAAVGVVLAASGLLVSAADPAYPSKPIRLISPFAAGGANDFLTRLCGIVLSEGLGQSVVVENRPGAGGTIGSDVVAKAPPDGLLLVLGSISTHSVAPAAYTKIPYNVNTDFTPIALFAEVPLLLVVHPSVPARNVAELIALAKAQPGKLNFGSSGNGTIPQLAGELFKSLAKVDMAHVPYKGDSAAVADLLGGQIQLLFANTPSAIGYVRSGQLRAIAVSTARRSPQLPDVPTLDESGLKGYDVSSWAALFGPPKLPQNVVDSLRAALSKGLQRPEVREKLRAQGAEPMTASPAEMAAFLQRDLERWAKVVAAAGIKIE